MTTTERFERLLERSFKTAARGSIRTRFERFLLRFAWYRTLRNRVTAFRMLKSYQKGKLIKSFSNLKVKGDHIYVDVVYYPPAEHIVINVTVE